MKAVILSGGQGTRLRPLTYSTPKQLIPVGGKPVLAHVLADVVSAGIIDIAVVTSPEAHDHVVAALERYGVPGVKPVVLIQDQPRGLAHALGVALPFVGGDPCVLYLGDCLVTGGISHVLAEHATGFADATILVRKVDDPSRYGIVEVGDGGDVVKLVEKPRSPESDLAIVGVYVFGSAIAGAVESVAPSWRGEYEITDAIQGIVDAGGRVRASHLRGWWIDTGTIEDVLVANRMLLDGLEGSVEGEAHDSELIGEVSVEPGALVRCSTIHGPVIVGEGSVVERAVLGPGTTLGRGVEVVEAEVVDSILMDSSVVGSARLAHSILGPGAKVSDQPRDIPLSVVVGADALIGSGAASQSG